MAVVVVVQMAVVVTAVVVVAVAVVVVVVGTLSSGTGLIVPSTPARRRGHATRTEDRGTVETTMTPVIRRVA